MSYQSRLREIQSAFVMSYHDRETCIEMLETLLHEFGFLPPAEQLDRTITNENFLALLKAAKDGDKDRMQRIDAETKINHEPLSSGAITAQYKIADSVKQRCPVCEKPINALFNRVQTLDQHFVSIDPPRCQECMMKWVQENFGEKTAPGPTMAEQYLAQEKARMTFSDLSAASPMKPDELSFFAEYEKQMGEV